MNELKLYIRLFSRKRLDHSSAAEQLEFLIGYENGILRPDECGSCDPYRPFDDSALPRCASWLAAAGGRFGFRRSTPPFEVEGDLSNLLSREIFMIDDDSSESKLLPGGPPPGFCVRWRIWIRRVNGGLPEPDLIKTFLWEACRVAHADYGFVAIDSDYRNKHFLSFRRNGSEVQQYIGDDPEQGIPGLYWMNFFGPMYVNWFGEEKIATLASHVDTVTLPGGALFLRFGELPDSMTHEIVLEQQRTVMRILGENAFFDIRRPERSLEVPPVLHKHRETLKIRRS
jgi:hypothetical protein